MREGWPSVLVAWPIRGFDDRIDLPAHQARPRRSRTERPPRFASTRRFVAASREQPGAAQRIATVHPLAIPARMQRARSPLHEDHAGWRSGWPSSRLPVAATACAASAASPWHTPSPPGTSVVDQGGRTRTDPHPKPTRRETQWPVRAALPPPRSCIAPPTRVCVQGSMRRDWGTRCLQSPYLPAPTATARHLIWPPIGDRDPFNCDARVAGAGEGGEGPQRARGVAPCETREKIMTACHGAADRGSA